LRVTPGMGQMSEMNGGCLGCRFSKTALNALTRGLGAVLVVDNVASGLSFGGIRTALDVSTEGCFRLAHGQKRSLSVP